MRRNLGKVDGIWRNCFGRAMLRHLLLVVWLSTCCGRINSQKLLLSDVKGRCPPSCPGSSFNSVE